MEKTSMKSLTPFLRKNLYAVLRELVQASQGTMREEYPWFADLANYLVTGQLPSDEVLSRANRLKLKSESRSYFRDKPYLWGVGSDQVIRRCIAEEEHLDILRQCHSLACGGHFGTKKTARKILDCEFYWPSIHKYAYDFYMQCEWCHFTGGITRRDEMLQIPIVVCKIFDIWGMDFMGPFPNSQEYVYILVTVDYVPKWIEAKVTKTSDSKEVTTFLKMTIFSRFRVTKAIISDQGTHFCNRTVEALMKKYEVHHRRSTPYILSPTVKIKYQIGRSRLYWRRR